jgi:hypothetical protein
MTVMHEWCIVIVLIAEAQKAQRFQPLPVPLEELAACLRDSQRFIDGNEACLPQVLHVRLEAVVRDVGPLRETSRGGLAFKLGQLAQELAEDGGAFTAGHGATS